MNLFEYMAANPGMVALLALIAGAVSTAGLVTFYHVCADVLDALKYKH